MKRLLSFFLLSLLSFEAMATEDWLCTEEASERKGNSLYSCGIGEAGTEALARSRAFTAAKEEFARVCSASDDCKEHRVTADPGRTSCEKHNALIRCYRLVVFTIESVERLIADAPKLAKKMTKQQVLSVLGIPRYSYIEWSPWRRLFFSYQGKMCLDETGCRVGFTSDGLVIAYEGFNPLYTDDLR